MDREKAVAARMRAAIAEFVVQRAEALRARAGPALVATLSAAAVTPVLVAGTSNVLVASGGVLGSVGANLLTDVIRDAAGRARSGRRCATPTGNVTSA